MPTPVITASKLVHRVGETLNPVYSATGADGTITWAGVGSFSVNPTTNGQQTTLFLDDVLAGYNRTWIWNITATDSAGGSPGVVSLSVYATFPLQPRFGYEVDFDNKTLVSLAEDGTAVFRKKAAAKRSWTLQFPGRPSLEYLILRDFWNFHEKTKEFYYYDLPLNELKLVRFDSGLRVQPDNMNLINMSCVLREV